MKKSFTFLILTIVLSSLFLWGCKKDDDELTITPINVDLFPLTVGHVITYSGYLRDAVADTNIIATGAVYQTTWTVASNNASLATIGMSGTASLILDSTTVPAPGPSIITKFNPVFVKRAHPTGTDNFSFVTSIGKFFRTFGITRPDSLKWILIADLTAGEGGSWTAFDSTYTYGGSHTVRLEIVGKWEGRENLTLNGTSFNTYKLTTRRNIYLDGSTTPAVGSGALTASIWLVENFGPVKMILNADGESYGNYREFKSKNW